MSSKEIDKVDNKEKSIIIGSPLKDNLKELFCIYYSKSLNRIDSYLKARKEIKDDDIQYTSATVLAQRLFKEEEIQRRIQELIDHTAKDIQISKARILEGIQEEINLDPASVFEWNGNALVLKSLEDIPDYIRKTIKSIKQGKDGIEVQFYDKQRAREQLMKYEGMLSDRLDVHVTHDLGDKLAAAHSRVLGRSGPVQAPEGIEDAKFEQID